MATARCLYCTLPLERDEPAQPRPIGFMPWRAADGTRLCTAHPQFGEREFTPHRPDQRGYVTERAGELAANG
jgi:hypothetical protein